MKRKMIKKFRHADRRIVKRIKHSDGIRDIAKTLIAKIKDYIQKVKGLKPLGKVVYVLNKLIIALGAFYAAKSVSDMKKQLNNCESYKKLLSSLFNTEPWDGDTELVVKRQGLKAILGLLVAFIAASREKIIMNPYSENGYEDSMHTDGLFDKAKAKLNQFQTKLKKFAATEPDVAAVVRLIAKIIKGLSTIGAAALTVVSGAGVVATIQLAISKLDNKSARIKDIIGHTLCVAIHAFLATLLRKVSRYIEEGFTPEEY